MRRSLVTVKKVPIGSLAPLIADFINGIGQTPT
jgi:hypothetical protein